MNKRLLLVSFLAFVHLGSVQDVQSAGRIPYGHTLRIGVEDTIRSFDPARATTEMEMVLATSIHQSLLRLNREEKIVPALLETLPVSRGGGQRWTCRLRRDLVFQDGRTQVTSDDVRKSIERLHGLGAESPVSWLSGVVGIEPDQSDSRAFDIVLRVPMDPEVLFWILALPQVAIVKEGRDRAGSGLRNRLWGLGPFALDNYQVNDIGRLMEISLEAFVPHVRGRPFVERIRFVVAHSGEEEKGLLRYNHVDLSFVEVADAEGVAPPERGPIHAALVLRSSRRLQGKKALLRSVAEHTDAERLIRFMDPSRPRARALHLWPERAYVPGEGSGSSLPASMTLRYDSGKAGFGMLRVADGIRLLWNTGGAVDAELLVGRDSERKGDFSLEQIHWFAGHPTLGAIQVIELVGVRDDEGRRETPASFLARGYGLDAPDSLRLLDQVTRSGKLIPIAFLHAVVHHRVGLHGIRFGTGGILTLEDLWWSKAP